MNKYLDAMAKPFMPITPWLLRLGLGIAFIYHGIGKFPLPPESCLLYTSPSPRDQLTSRMPSSA